MGRNLGESVEDALDARGDRRWEHKKANMATLRRCLRAG